METKLFEIRDHGTFIPAIGTLMSALDDSNDFEVYDRERWLLRRAGYASGELVLLARLDGGGQAEYDPYAWANRTWFGAHLYIQKHWHSLKSGDVVDARVGLGETTIPVPSERGEL